MKWETITCAEAAAREDVPIYEVVAGVIQASVTLMWKWERKKRVSASGEKGEWKIWVFVAQSVALRKGAAGGCCEQGLYAWKAFDRDDVIGKYSGGVTGEYEARKTTRRARDVATRESNDKLLEVVRGTKVVIIDGNQAGPQYLQRANEARGLVSWSGQAS